MMPFSRGKSKTQQTYIPTGPGRVQKTLGTSDVKLARRIEKAIAQMADDKEWTVLRAIADDRITIDDFWASYQLKAIDQLKARLSSRAIADLLGHDGENGEAPSGWCADAQRNAPAAWRDQVSMVRKLTKGLTFASELEAGVIRDRMNALTVSSGTARHYLYALSSFCSYCVAHKALLVNPCESRSAIPRPKKSGKRKVWHTADVDQRIVNSTSGDVRVALAVCAGSSADRATPLLMHVRDVHLLAPGVAPDKAQGREHRVDLPGTKAEGRDRRGVRLEPWAAEILREAIKGKHPDAPLISGVSKGMLTTHWAVACASQRVKGYWLRDTRHSYGCRAFLAGYPLWEISKWLGHADAAITAGIYLQFDYAIARLVQAGGSTLPTTAHELTTNLTTSDSSSSASPHLRKA